ncbi:IS4 family transposase [Mucilaginibacter sp. R-33]|uniref:IS4 family transposase n=1 Tax=Mucilaginibacter sp. R-33 TaxID=3416711 RepID=UPI003CF0DE4C
MDPDKLSELARKSGFLQRQSKLKPSEFIDTLMFSDLDHSQLSLQDCCNDLAQQHQKSLSKVGLHKRFNTRTLDFLKSVLSTQMALKLDHGQLNSWQPFSRVLIADSSKFTLPDQFAEDYPGFGNFGVSSIMNIQYSFDLKHGNWENLELTKATENDQSHSGKTLDRICKDELHIRDLGFVTLEYLARVIKEEAFFLNRPHPQVKFVQCSNGKQIDWVKLYQKMQNNNNHFDTEVIVGTGKDAITCRLIALPVPEAVWSERIRKAEQKAKSQKSKLTDKYKTRCKFSVFITNTTKESLNAAAIIQLYRLRWQIELVFKTWKSLFGIHQIKAVKKDRLECQLIAKFIWILLNWKIFRCIDAAIQKGVPGYACSMWKFFKQARQFDYALRKVVKSSMSFEQWCEIFIFPIIKNMLIEPKKRKKAAFEIVYDIFNPLG